MCLDYRSLDLKELRLNIHDLITPSSKTIAKLDPIWGEQPESALPFTVGVKKHGKLIEKTIIKLARASTQWDGVQSYKMKVNGKNREFDNIVFNKNLKVIIVLESKRDANQVSGPYVERIKQYIGLLPSEAKRIGFFLLTGFAGFNLYFATFNAYGAHKTDFCGKPVIEPKHLNAIFSDCVSLGWQAFEKEKYNFFKKSNIPVNESFEARVKGYLDFDELKERSSQSECQFDDPQGPNKTQIHQQAIDNILGKPMLTIE